jgi:hypothetical protein
MIHDIVSEKRILHISHPNHLLTLLDLHALHHTGTRSFGLFLPRSLLLLLVLVPQIADIQVAQELPPVLPHMVQVVRVTRVPVPVSGGDDRTSTEFLSFFVGQVPVVTLSAIVDRVSKLTIQDGR